MALIKDQQLSFSHAATPETKFADWLSAGIAAGDAVLANGADDLPSLLAHAEKLSMIAIEFDTFAVAEGLVWPACCVAKVIQEKLERLVMWRWTALTLCSG